MDGWYIDSSGLLITYSDGTEENYGFMPLPPQGYGGKVTYGPGKVYPIGGNTYAYEENEHVVYFNYGSIQQY